MTELNRRSLLTTTRGLGRVWALCLTGASIFGGCADDGGTSDGSTSTSTSTSGATTSGGSSEATSEAPDSSTSDGVDGDPGPPPFDLHRDNVRLLPFAIRHNRLSLLLDLPPDDPVFSVLLARRFDLGDYDFSKGINPDLTWTTSRMANWVAAMRPVCGSAPMKARYPEFPLDLAALMSDAYGFVPSPADLEPYEDLLGDAELDEATRYETVCLAVLSQLEFVAL
jgi:hypothetical protein